MRIGIVGMGVVGRAIYAYHAEREPKIWCCDKRQDYENQVTALNDNAEIVFVAVPTPYGGVGQGLDCSAVYEAVGKLTVKEGYGYPGECDREGCSCHMPDSPKRGKTVIIKSTVNPGTTDDLQAKYPEHRFFFVPEFLSADTAAADYAHPRRPHVIGLPVALYIGDSEDLQGAKDVIESLPNEPNEVGMPYLLLALQAELLKLATNAWYATKVTFANQLFDIGMEQGTLDAMALDPWIGNSHLTVMHKGYRGTSGACLPKDTKALVDYAFNMGKCDRRFLPGEAVEYNKRLMDANTEDRRQTQAHEG